MANDDWELDDEAEIDPDDDDDDIAEQTPAVDEEKAIAAAVKKTGKTVEQLVAAELRTAELERRTLDLEARLRTPAAAAAKTEPDPADDEVVTLRDVKRIAGETQRRAEIAARAAATDGQTIADCNRAIRAICKSQYEGYGSDWNATKERIVATMVGEEVGARWEAMTAAERVEAVEAATRKIVAADVGPRKAKQKAAVEPGNEEEEAPTGGPRRGRETVTRTTGDAPNVGRKLDSWQWGADLSKPTYTHADVDVATKADMAAYRKRLQHSR